MNLSTSARCPLSLNLAILTFVSEFMVSSNLLEAIGIPYVEEGGPLLLKLNPGTYLAAAAMAARLVERGHPFRSLWRLAALQPVLARYIGSMLFCIAYATSETGSGGVVALLDTFLPAGMIAVALHDLDWRQAARLAGWLRALFLINATLALIEAAAGAHLVPLFAQDPTGSEDFRPTGLYDHPLTGAAATMMGLLLCPDTRRAPRARRAYQLWMFAALLAFGGRVALIVAVIGAALLLILGFTEKASTWRFSAADLAMPIAGALLTAPLAASVVGVGMADRLAAHMYWDGSAQVRVGQFHLLDMLNAQQLLFGCRRSDLIALIEPLRLAYGVAVIENFWLLMFATLGALCFPLFVLGLWALVRWLWGRAALEGRIMIVSLFLVASTSNSLGRKSTLLVMLVGCVLAQGHPAISARLRGFRSAPLGPSAMEM